MSRGQVGAQQMPKLSHCVERRNLYTWVVSNGMKFSGQITPLHQIIRSEVDGGEEEGQGERREQTDPKLERVCNNFANKGMRRVSRGEFIILEADWTPCYISSFTLQLGEWSLPHSSQWQQFILLSVSFLFQALSAPRSRNKNKSIQFARIKLLIDIAACFRWNGFI